MPNATYFGGPIGSEAPFSTGLLTSLSDTVLREMDRTNSSESILRLKHASPSTDPCKASQGSDI